MNSTPGEFRRALVQAFGDAVSATAEGVALSAAGVRLHFALTSRAATQIGELQIAHLHVEISVQEGDEAAAQELLARVDRATQRGGG
jgi:hypothetical protein